MKKIDDKTRPDVQIIELNKPSFSHKGEMYTMKSHMVHNYNSWLEELYDRDAKVVYLHSMWWQLTTDNEGKVKKDYRHIIHWVRFCIVERYDEDGNTLILKRTSEPNDPIIHYEWVKE